MAKRFLIAGFFLAVAATCVLLGWPFALPFINGLHQAIKHDSVIRREPFLYLTTLFKFMRVNVVHAAPFKYPFIGHGIYLGSGKIITAAHVVGRGHMFKHLRVLIRPRFAGESTQAK